MGYLSNANFRQAGMTKAKSKEFSVGLERMRRRNAQNMKS
jgi:hypothetical protein